MIDRCSQAPQVKLKHMSAEQDSLSHVYRRIFQPDLADFDVKNSPTGLGFGSVALAARSFLCVRKGGGGGVELGSFQFWLSHNPHSTVVGSGRFEKVR